MKSLMNGDNIENICSVFASCLLIGGGIIRAGADWSASVTESDHTCADFRTKATMVIDQTPSEVVQFSASENVSPVVNKAHTAISIAAGRREQVQDYLGQLCSGSLSGPKVTSKVQETLILNQVEKTLDVASVHMKEFWAPAVFYDEEANALEMVFQSNRGRVELTYLIASNSYELYTGDRNARIASKHVESAAFPVAQLAEALSWIASS